MITKVDKAEYFSEEVRRATYKTWIFSSNKPCSANKMAEAGFVFTGSSREPDSAQCFYCNKCLDGWEDTDDPWTEHLKHGVNCDFAKMQKSQGDWTLEEWFEMRKKFEKNLITKKYNEIIARKNKHFECMRMLVNKLH